MLLSEQVSCDEPGQSKWDEYCQRCSCTVRVGLEVKRSAVEKGADRRVERAEDRPVQTSLVSLVVGNSCSTTS